MRAAIYIFCFIALHAGSIGQDMAPDTILQLSDVTIYSARISGFAKGQHIESLDSLSRAEYSNGTLADVLPGFTSVYIKNYGQGTLSTLSTRGTSSNHTAILWNGIRVAPPNIGFVDLSLIQANFFSDISFLYGGASPMFGSGSIGGGLHLENRPVFGKQKVSLAMSLSGGSFGLFAVDGSGVVSSEKFYSRTALSFKNATNNFTFENLDGHKENMPHARVLNSGIIQDIAFKLPNNQHVMASVWFQYAGREIPPTLSEGNSEAFQTDRSLRTMVLWKDYNALNTLEAKMAYFNEYTLYEDPLTFIRSVIQSQSAIGSFESSWEIGSKSALYTGAQFTYEYADLVNYGNPQNQQTLAIFGSYSYRFPSLKWQVSVNGRQEFFSEYQSPFLFSAGAEGLIWPYIKGRLNVSRNFRSPTFNERFWQPGGNPDLEPEQSWNEEAGVSFDQKFASFRLKLDFTAFNSRVDDWILWLPQSSNYWVVENAQEVWSRGIEISGDQIAELGPFTLILFESYTFSRSTNEKKLNDLDASYKKQLIYTPVHRFVIKPGALFKGFYVAVKGIYTGDVYTSKDNLDVISPYFLADLTLSKSFKIKKEKFTIQFNLNNLFNTDYQVTPYRPMPGINFLVTVKGGLDY